MSNLPAYAQFLLTVLARLAKMGIRPLPEGSGPKNFVTFEAPTGHRTHVKKAATAMKVGSIDTTYKSSYTLSPPAGYQNGAIVGFVPADRLVQHLEEMYADDEVRVSNRGFASKVARAKVSLDDLIAASEANEETDETQLAD